MKKTLCTVLLIFAIAVMSIPAAATQTEREAISADGITAIAYLTIDEGTTSRDKDAILAAREEIIYSQSWVADGLTACVFDKNGNVKEYLPHFSELFPNDWELPIAECSQENSADASVEVLPNALSSTRSSSIIPFFSDEIDLKRPASGRDTAPFVTFSTVGFKNTSAMYTVEKVWTEGYYHSNPTDDATYNIGYTNVDTGRSISNKNYLENTETFALLDVPYDITLGVRASSYDNPGSWAMYVNAQIEKDN